ncbi:uncharacterized protein LOC126942447 [Macaca thibetana thibetana]|uniref:uncharacterized protein LOC126942447 n=1 Tax=Macaca thibetana thibetana TaxID=257877 RepID=UPI0021BCE984|nr:uncharacterized protein LOC126942447 [Macaca thibetana thibetana]
MVLGRTSSRLAQCSHRSRRTNMAQDKHNGKSENLGLSPGPAPILRGTHGLRPLPGAVPSGLRGALAHAERRCSGLFHSDVPPAVTSIRCSPRTWGCAETATQASPRQRTVMPVKWLGKLGLGNEEALARAQGRKALSDQEAGRGPEAEPCGHKLTEGAKPLTAQVQQTDPAPELS